MCKVGFKTNNEPNEPLFETPVALQFSKFKKNDQKTRTITKTQINKNYY